MLVDVGHFHYIVALVAVKCNGVTSKLYRITRMFCEYQIFVRVDKFATIKSKNLLVNQYTRSLPERNS